MDRLAGVDQQPGRDLRASRDPDPVGAVRGGHRRGTRVPAGPRRVGPSGLIPRGTLRKQPHRGRPRQAQTRLRPIHGLCTDRNAQVVIAGLAFIQNLRRGHYGLGLERTPRCGSPPRSPNWLGDLKVGPARHWSADRSDNATMPLISSPSRMGAGPETTMEARWRVFRSPLTPARRLGRATCRRATTSQRR